MPKSLLLKKDGRFRRLPAPRYVGPFVQLLSYDTALLLRLHPRPHRTRTHFIPSIDSPPPHMLSSPQIPPPPITAARAARGSAASPNPTWDTVASPMPPICCESPRAMLSYPCVVPPIAIQDGAVVLHLVSSRSALCPPVPPPQPRCKFHPARPFLSERLGFPSLPRVSTPGGPHFLFPEDLDLSSICRENCCASAGVGGRDLCPATRSNPMMDAPLSSSISHPAYHQPDWQPSPAWSLADCSVSSTCQHAPLRGPPLLQVPNSPLSCEGSMLNFHLSPVFSRLRFSFENGIA